MKDIVHIGDLLQKTESVRHQTNSSKDLKRSYVSWIDFSLSSESCYSFPRWDFQHDLVSNLEFKAFSSEDDIFLLTVTGGLQSLS